MGLPFDVRDLLVSGAQMQKDRDLPVRIVVLLEPGAPDELLDAVKQHVRPQTAGASVQVEVVEPGVEFAYEPGVDAVIAVCGPGSADLRRAIDPARSKTVPVILLGLGESNDALSAALAHPLGDTIVFLDAERVAQHELADWFVDRLGHKRLALAHNFAFIRREVASDAVRATAWQNALIGGVTIIPGADMPLMTANQAKMVMQIAAAYGERLGPERISELAAVVGGGFAFRTLARQLLTAVPGLGWAIKAGIGYTGTVAMGKAAIRYFESGADFSEVMKYVGAARDAVMSRARKLRRGGAPAALPEPAQGLPPVEEGTEAAAAGE